MGKIENLGHPAQLIEQSRYFFSFQISYCSSLNFSVQFENGQDYQSGVTLNEAE
jgi:hypothetical protein